MAARELRLVDERGRHRPPRRRALLARDVDADDDDPREARAVDLDPVAPGRQHPDAGRDAPAPGGLPRPPDGLSRRDPELPARDLAAVEADPSRPVQPPPAEQRRSAVARPDVPEDLRPEPRAAVLVVAERHEEPVREARVHRAGADPLAAEDVRPLPGDAAVDLADRARGA